MCFSKDIFSPDAGLRHECVELNEISGNSIAEGRSCNKGELLQMKESYKELIRRAEAWIDAHKDEFISEIQGLVKFPSVSRADLAEDGAPFGPECRKVLDYALERGRHYGFETHDYDGYAGAIYMGDPDDSLGMIAHLDVVPVGDGWIYPQFEATHLPEHNVLIGRGVGDNKGPAVVGLFAMRMLREFGYPLKHGIKLFCGMSEETGMQDIQALVERGETFPKTTLVPDAGFPVNYGQKGSLDGDISAQCEGNLLSFESGSARNIIPDKATCVIKVDLDQVNAAIAALDAEVSKPLTVTACEDGVQITAIGRAGHAAGPDGGINAIWLLCRALTQARLLEGSCASAIAELADLASDGYLISEGASFEDEVSGKTTLVYTSARLRNGKLCVGCDCRASIMIDQQWLSETLTKDWYRRGYEIDKLELTKPFYIPKDDARVVALQELYHEITGRDEQPYTMGGGTYSRVMPNAISFGAGMPGSRHTFDFLPEGHGGAHGKDEVQDLNDLFNCAKIYTVALAMLDELVD